MKKYWLSWLMLAVALAVTLFTYHALPENMAVHWGIDGQADGFAPKWIASLMVPLLMVAMILMLHLLPKIDPNRKNYEQFQGAYNMISAGIVSLLFVLHLVVILQGLGYSIPIPTLMTLLVGALFILIGNYLPRVRTNFFLGIRTPWTLSDEEVWRKTHRIGGKMFVAGGVLMLLASLLPSTWQFTVLMTVVVTVSLGSFILSYLFYKRKQS